MRQIRFELENEFKTGIISEDGKLIYPVEHSAPTAHHSMSENTVGIEIERVKLLTPTNPSKIVCVGRNYAEHAAELGNEIPQNPLLFLKAPSSVILESEFIEIPPQSNQIEHEGELGIVIGQNCKNLTDDDKTFDFILGFICLNDVTARDIQKADIQFTRAKSFDTFCSISKFITTGIDVSDLRIMTKVNGVLKQEGRTSQMVFPVGFLVKYISNQMTLNFGDIIATGTPSGVSVLKEGDVCEIEIESVGKISNPVRKAL